MSTNISIQTELRISQTLKDLGISPALSGYSYLRYAIRLTMYDPTLVHRLTTELYIKVAQYHGKTWKSVERSIRHAIATSWNEADYDLQRNIFGFSTKSRRGVATNGEFIASVADYLLMTTGVVQ